MFVSSHFLLPFDSLGCAPRLASSHLFNIQRIVMVMKKLLFGPLVLIAGCTVIPARVSVTDVGSGKHFETYDGEPYAKENMLGYNFVDLSSGDMVMLKSYTRKTVEPAKIIWWGSPEASEFKDSLRNVKQ